MMLFKQIWMGKSLARALMNKEIAGYSVNGAVLDIGGGKSSDYLSFLSGAESAQVTVVDLLVNGPIKSINLEKDSLPFIDKAFDVVLLFNILEHIYNHQRVVKEAHRVLKQGGKIIGFVPFLVNYHPDPHDYFRYTKEALVKLFEDQGFSSVLVREVGGGPFLVNFNNICLSLPRVASVLLFPVYSVLDCLFLLFRPKARFRFPLGFLFSLEKN